MYHYTVREEQVSILKQPPRAFGPFIDIRCLSVRRRRDEVTNQKTAEPPPML